MKKERIVIEVTHDGEEVWELESWVEGEKMVEGDDIVEEFAHLSSVLATQLGHIIAVTADNVESAMFVAGEFAAMITDQIEGEFEEDDEYG